MNIKQHIKRITPPKIWNFLRHHKDIILDRINNIGRKVCKIKYFGYDVSYLPGDILVKKIKGNKIFEEKMCLKIESELNKHNDAVFVDIGANIGLISLFMKSRIKKTKIFAFEPGPYQSQMFGRTISTNNIEGVFLNKIALGSEDKTVQFISHFSPDSSGDGLIDTGRAGEPIPVSVRMMKLDSWWLENQKPMIHVMKIDTEGSELLILRGAKDAIRQTRPTIYIEIEPKNLKVYPYKRDDLLLWFHENDYSLYTLDGNECLESNFTSFIGKYDTYIARPK